MRIGLLCHEGLGGSSQVALRLGERLVRRGHHVSLFARRPPHGMGPASRVRYLGLPANGPAPEGRLEVAWPERDGEALLGRISLEAATEGLDVLHFHYALPFARLAAAAKRRLGERAPAVVGTLHGTDVSIHGYIPDESGTLAHAIARIDRVTTVSLSHAELAARVLRLPEPPRVIANFVDVHQFRPRTEPRPTGRPRIVHVSNLRPVKDPRLLAEVFSELRTTVDAELWIVGPEDGAEVVRTHLAARGLATDLRVFGARRDVHRILPHADVFLLTSRLESFGLAALEAAACGLPVVAPAVGGLPEVVEDGSTGLLFPSGDRLGAVERLRWLLRAPVRLAAMGRLGSKRARRFSPDRAVDGYEALYLEAVARRSRPLPAVRRR